jgi:hypothetical protein
LVLEANHDLKLLQEDTKRPWAVKQRIVSRHGHLSNEAAALVAEQIAWEGLRQIYLGHLSSDCNRPELALHAVQQILTRMGAHSIALMAARQDIPCPRCSLDSPAPIFARPAPPPGAPEPFLL